MALLYYLIEANVYLCILYAFYCVILKNETFYNLNRWYLILAATTAFLLPVITVQNIAGQPVDTNIYTALQHTATEQQANHNSTAQTAKIISSLNVHGLKDVLPLVYFIVTCLFVIFSCIGVINIIRIYRGSEKYRNGPVTHVLLKDEDQAYSFFNWLFHHAGIKENSPVLAHEMVHINEKHSFDLLYFELLCAFNWFNPLVYFMFRDVKLNHEYIADDVAAAKAKNKYEYAHLLIKNAGGPIHRHAHAIFNRSQLERRIKNLNRNKSVTWARLKYLLCLPLTAALLMVSAFMVDKDYALLTFHTAAARKPLPAQSSLASVNMLIPKNTGGAKLKAKDYMLAWTVNAENAVVRNPVHSIFSGSEAQLFRGRQADTLYIDEGNYKITNDTIEVTTNQLLIGQETAPGNINKKLVVINAKERSIILTLPQVAIKTKGAVYAVRAKFALPPGSLQLVSYNTRIQYATVTGNQILTGKEDSHAPYQPGIIW